MTDSGGRVLLLFPTAWDAKQLARGEALPEPAGSIPAASTASSQGHRRRRGRWDALDVASCRTASSSVWSPWT